LTSKLFNEEVNPGETKTCLVNFEICFEIEGDINAGNNILNCGSAKINVITQK
jgi:hypothetical protein